MSRLSLHEVSEIARISAQRRAVVYGRGPTVDGVAQALGLPPAQVQILLSEIRGDASGGLADGNPAQMRRNLIGAGVAGGVLVLLLALTLLRGGSGGGSPAPSSPPIVSVPTPTFSPAVASAGNPRAAAIQGSPFIAQREGNGASGPFAGSGASRSTSDYVHDPQHRLVGEAEEAMKSGRRQVVTAKVQSVQ